MGGEEVKQNENQNIKVANKSQLAAALKIEFFYLEIIGEFNMIVQDIQKVMNTIIMRVVKLVSIRSFQFRKT
ncbi:hypothetical protein BpHYR1_008882 [Brachionus plicatilis]|uniref:Uncharacterized protein n=1 Tax=Brachionus plicatilis TaxID=10195 RepID=A0A3M7R8Q6_BRAPC|nr:hypothetical protein BpHYR1_008882 [Brachionus plicatilis]